VDTTPDQRLASTGPIGLPHYRKITFKLNAAGARALRKLGRLRVTVTLVSRVGHNKPITNTKTFTIKAPPRKHKQH
jgi:hypothetical protein